MGIDFDILDKFTNELIAKYTIKWLNIYEPYAYKYCSNIPNAIKYCDEQINILKPQVEKLNIINNIKKLNFEQKKKKIIELFEKLDNTNNNEYYDNCDSDDNLCTDNIDLLIKDLYNKVYMCNNNKDYEIEMLDRFEEFKDFLCKYIGHKSEISY